MAADIRIRLLTEINQSLKEIQKFQKGATKQLKKVDKGVQNVAKSTSLLSSSVTKAAAAFTAFNQGVQSIQRVVGAFSGVVEAANRQEDAINNLNIALARTGEFSIEASREIQEFANQIQRTTTVGDEAAIEAFNLAKSFGATNEQAKNLTRAAIELSAATGKSLDETIRQTSKTLGGFAGELGEVNPAIKALTQEELKAGKAAEILLSQFGGTAQAQLNTFAGATAQLSNAFGDLLEEIGFLITKNRDSVSSVKTLTGAIQSLTDFIKANAQTIRTAFESAATAVSFFVAAFAFSKILKFLKITTFLAASLKGVGVAAKVAGLSIRGALVATGIGAAIVGATFLIEKFSELAREVGGFGDAAQIVAIQIQKAFLFAAKSIGFIGTKIADLLSGLPGVGGAFEKFGTLARAATDGVGEKIKELDKRIKELRKPGAAVNVEITAQVSKNFGKETKKAGDQFKKDTKKAAQNIAGELAGALAGALGGAVSGAADVGQQIRDAQSGIATTLKEIETSTRDESAKRIQQIRSEASLRNEQIKEQFLQGKITQAQLAAEQRKIESETAKAIAKEREEQELRITEKTTQARLQNEDQIRKLEEQRAKGLERGALSAIGEVGKIVGKAFGPVGQIIAGIVITILELLTKAPDIIAQQIDGIANALISIVQKIGENLGPFIQNLIQTVLQSVIDTLASSEQFLTSLIEGVVTALLNIVDRLPEFIGGILDQVIVLLEDGLPRIIQQLSDGVVALVIKITEKAPEIVAAITEKAPAIAIALSKLMPQVAISLTKSIIDLFKSSEGRQQLLNVFKNVLIGGAQAFVDAVVKGVGDALGIGGTREERLERKQDENVLVRAGKGLFTAGLSELLGFQSGGVVPGVGFGDKVAIAAEPGERVLSNQDRGEVQQLLDEVRADRLLGESGGQQSLTVNLMVGEEQLSSVLVDLSAKGFRTA